MLPSQLDPVKRPTFDNNRVAIFNCDCEVLRGSNPDVIIADPPYPDYHTEIYKQTDIKFLNDYHCKKIVFWSAKAEFPLAYSAIHIWDKKTGVGSEYERIFECSGGKQYKMFRYYLINSRIAANHTGDVFTGHPSQKPYQLMLDLVLKFSKPDDLVFDPFMGSGTTAIACIKSGRRFIGAEIKSKWFKIAKQRIKLATSQGGMSDILEYSNATQ